MVRRPGVLLQLRGPAAVRDRRRAPSRARSRPSRRRAGSLRYADAACRPTARLALRPRGPHAATGARGGQRHRGLPLDGSAPPAGAGRRARLLLVAAPIARRPRLAWLAGTIQTCPGTAPSSGSRTTDGGLSTPAGRRRPDESIFQPEWSPDGALHFVSDRSGLVEPLPRGDEPRAPVARWRRSSAGPAVGVRPPTLRFLADGRLVCTWTEHDGAHPGDGLPVRVQPDGSCARSPTAFTEHRLAAAHRRATASSPSPARPTQSPAVVAIDPDERRHRGPASRARSPRSTPATLDRRSRSSSRPRAGSTAHASSTRRANQDYTAPAGERPPLLVISHGGPTSATVDRAQPAHPVLDQPRVRRGRRQLRRQHRLRPRLPAAAQRRSGASSTSADCINAARYLAERGDADRAAAGHPRRQRRRLHHAVRARLPRRVRGRARATTASPTPRRWRATPTSSSRATSTA